MSCSYLDKIFEAISTPGVCPRLRRVSIATARGNEPDANVVTQEQLRKLFRFVFDEDKLEETNHLLCQSFANLRELSLEMMDIIDSNYVVEEDPDDPITCVLPRLARVLDCCPLLEDLHLGCTGSEERQ